METFGITLAIVLSLPAAAALVAAGAQWYQSSRRLQQWEREETPQLGMDSDEETTRALLAWCEARQAQDRLGLSTPRAHDVRLPRRSDYLSPEAFRRGAFQYELGHQPGQGLSGGVDGTARVHLLLDDGAGHYFRVERKLFLN